ncbi:MAG: hypothetical protein WCL71_00220 [Deltaproteobacteria bacterium]
MSEEFNTMVINSKVIAIKNQQIDAIHSRPEVLQKLIENQGFHDSEIKKINRIWEPGGGSSLFKLLCPAGDIFLKVKSSEILVENRLECEKQFPTSSSLSNEWFFLTSLASSGLPWVPKVFFYDEIDNFQFIGFEFLSSFHEQMSKMTIEHILIAWTTIEAAVRHLYSNGIVHTDIHENNICFRGSQPILIDFEEMRYLKQEVPFQESLDVAGENKYGKVGEFPEGHSKFSGRTCLNRLKKVFQFELSSKLPKLLEKCHFDQGCQYNLDELQEADARIYQSVSFDGTNIEGQRPLRDERLELIDCLFRNIQISSKNIVHLDIGSNLGRFCIQASKIPRVLESHGVEASSNYVLAAKAIAFVTESKNALFHNLVCGVDSIFNVCPNANIVTMLSVYHHISYKDYFLNDIKKLPIDYLIGEFATQDRFYPERGTMNAELMHIGHELNLLHQTTISISADYFRPIVLFSRYPIPTSLINKINVFTAGGAFRFTVKRIRSILSYIKSKVI